MLEGRRGCTTQLTHNTMCRGSAHTYIPSGVQVRSYICNYSTTVRVCILVDARGHMYVDSANVHSYMCARVGHAHILE